MGSTSVTSAGSQIRRGVLCSLAALEPVDWKRGEKIDFTKSSVAENLLQNVNKHHVFPVKFLKDYAAQNPTDKDFVTTHLNSISNIAYLTFEDNVSDPIRDNDPKIYVPKLSKLNPDLESAFEKALLPSPNEFSSLSFKDFLGRRATILAGNLCELAGLGFGIFINSEMKLAIVAFERSLRDFLISKENVISVEQAYTCLPSKDHSNIEKRVEKRDDNTESGLTSLAKELSMGQIFMILGHKKFLDMLFEKADRAEFLNKKEDLLKANKIRHGESLPKDGDVTAAKASLDYFNRLIGKS